LINLYGHKCSLLLKTVRREEREGKEQKEREGESWLNLLY
jgi:hypothetical protein